MTKVILLTPMAGAVKSYVIGDEFPATDDEAVRLVAAGFATWPADLAGAASDFTAETIIASQTISDPVAGADSVSGADVVTDGVVADEKSGEEPAAVKPSRRKGAGAGNGDTQR